MIVSAKETDSHVPFSNVLGERLLYESDAISVSSKGFRLRQLGSNSTQSYLRDYSKSLMEKTCSWWTLERISRGGFSLVRVLNDKFLLAVARKRILTIDIESGDVVSEAPVFKGSRPLSLEVTPEGICYYGEYFGNSDRSPVRIFGGDGFDWEVVYEFRAGEVRHVHGVVYDPFRGGIWVMTGDDGSEAGIWYTDNGFKDLAAVSRGSQRARSVGVIPVERGLIVPMDTPFEKNFLNFLDISTGQYDAICELPGSSLSALQNGDIFLVSTAVEASQVNTNQYAHVFGSIDGVNWKVIASLSRDLPWTKNMRPYLQWPSVSLVQGDGSSKFVSGFCVALKDLDGCSIQWERSVLREYLISSGGGA